MEPLLEINHINYAYHSMQGETPALQNIHFTVCKGDFIAVVGPSGCGKTTLLSLIAGLLLPEEGEILLNGKRLQEQSNNPIGYMLQKDHLLEWRTTVSYTHLSLPTTRSASRKRFPFGDRICLHTLYFRSFLELQRFTYAGTPPMIP